MNSVDPVDVAIMLLILLAAGVSFWTFLPKWKRRKTVEEKILRPGQCECNCRRCSHEKGIGRCYASHVLDGTRYACACQIYIPVKDDNGPSDDPSTPSPAELERWYTN